MSKNLMMCARGADDGTLQHPTTSIDVEFRNLTYTVSNWRNRGSKKNVLKGVSGRFKSGELTAIMGPSGAGKSSLLNALSGFRSCGIQGDLLTNGEKRNERLFQKISCYLTQDDYLQPLLSVNESMMIAASFKLPSSTSKIERQTTINEILKTLGLLEARNVCTTSLSGGQKKRLSIALELINNPPIFFLDEPTSGLDNVAAKQCISLLKTLAMQGRTIVCTIHQPSASIFGLFDHVYVVAKGLCVYQGSTKALVPYLHSVGIHCPTHYNPADFVIEVCDNDESTITALSSVVQNGNLSWTQYGVDDIKETVYKRPSAVLPDEQENQGTSADTSSESGSSEQCITEGLGFSVLRYHRIGHTKSLGYATSQWQQFITLFKRMIIQIFRNRVALRIQLFHHVFCGLIVGCVFFNQANDGSKMFNHMKFCIGVILFHTYTWLMVPVLLFPSEVKVMKKEFFNQWYSLSPYYMALQLSKVPTQIFFSMIFLSMVYFMSGLPTEFQRFFIFSLIGVITSMVAEGLGLAVASILNVTNGSAAVPAIIAPFLGLAVYGFDFANKISWMMNAVMKLSFLRCGVVALAVTIFGMGRKKLDCYEIYCHYSDPKVILRMVDIEHVSVWTPVMILCAFMLVFRIVCYIGLRWRVTT
ncbi:ATP-binding cassette sub-family G member 1 isoform X2 [Anabrus simplex]